MLIQACLNGQTTREKHPAVPQTPGELAADAAAAHAAGAATVHIHPRDASGGQTLEPVHVLAAVAAVRAAVPGLPVGVTTGIWATGGDTGRRLELVAGWTGENRPDYASINLCEPGADGLADLLHGLGIAIEAGVWTPGDADSLGASGFGHRVIRVVLEPVDDTAEAAIATAARTEAALDRHGLTAPRLHHGYGTATWGVIRAALQLGRDFRIGLEDTTVLPDGSPATGNAQLVAAAVDVAAG